MVTVTREPILALLHESLQLAELSLIATDRNVVDHDHPFHLPPTSLLAKVIIDQSVALQASLDAYERALDCEHDADDNYLLPF